MGLAERLAARFDRAHSAVRGLRTAPVQGIPIEAGRGPDAWECAESDTTLLPVAGGNVGARDPRPVAVGSSVRRQGSNARALSADGVDRHRAAGVDCALRSPTGELAH